MLQLTYMSTAAPSLSMNEAEQILRISRRNNSRVGLTGLLIFDGKRFLQALEGDRSAVEQTISRIRNDTRHRGIVELSRSIIQTREFGTWAMASEVVGPIIGNGDIVGTVTALTETLQNGHIRGLFRAFARIRASSTEKIDPVA